MYDHHFLAVWSGSNQGEERRGCRQGKCLGVPHPERYGSLVWCPWLFPSANSGGGAQEEGDALLSLLTHAWGI